jgi:hypothetical protein
MLFDDDEKCMEECSCRIHWNDALLDFIRAAIDSPSRIHPVGYILPDSGVYVVDGVVSRNKPININPNNIVSIDILKRDSTSIFDGLAMHDVIIILTKANAIHQYQKKIAAFSKKYKAYLGNGKRDTDFIYDINGLSISGDERQKIKRLFDLKADTIQTVSMTRSGQPHQMKRYFVHITTKAAH